MLLDVDKIAPYERQQLLVALGAILNSPQFNRTQKTCCEAKFQEIVEILTSKEYIT